MAWLWVRLRALLPLAVVSTTMFMAVATWWISTGGPLAYFTHHVPVGQAYFVFSKLFALLAFTLLWLQCMTALTKHAPVLRGFLSLQPRYHALLGAVTFALIVGHVTFFMAASTLRTEHWAFDQLLPRFDAGYYKSLIGIGAIAAWMTLLVVLAGWLRTRGFVQARWIHRAGLAVFALGFIHGVSIGSETRFGVMKYVYALAALSLGAALLSCVYAKLRERSRRLRDPLDVQTIDNQLQNHRRGA